MYFMSFLVFSLSTLSTNSVDHSHLQAKLRIFLAGFSTAALALSQSAVLLETAMFVVAVGCYAQSLASKLAKVHF